MESTKPPTITSPPIFKIRYGDNTSDKLNIPPSKPLLESGIRTGSKIIKQTSSVTSDFVVKSFESIRDFTVYLLPSNNEDDIKAECIEIINNFRTLITSIMQHKIFMRDLKKQPLDKESAPLLLGATPITYEFLYKYVASPKQRVRNPVNELRKTYVRGNVPFQKVADLLKYGVESAYAIITLLQKVNSACKAFDENRRSFIKTTKKESTSASDPSLESQTFYETRQEDLLKIDIFKFGYVDNHFSSEKARITRCIKSIYEYVICLAQEYHYDYFLLVDTVHSNFLPTAPHLVNGPSKYFAGYKRDTEECHCLNIPNLEMIGANQKLVTLWKVFWDQYNGCNKDSVHITCSLHTLGSTANFNDRCSRHELTKSMMVLSDTYVNQVREDSSPKMEFL